MEKQLENSSDYVSSLLNTYSSLSEYFEEIAYHLNCEISDLRMLSSQDDNDEEGWEIKSFFPQGAKIEKEKMLYENYHTKDFAVGSVYKVQVDGKTYIAEVNASPFIVWSKRQRVNES